MNKFGLRKRRTVVITGVIILTVISVFFLSITFMRPPSLPLFSTVKKYDKFGILEIYPTEVGGREWYINMEDPTSDGIFNPQSNISRQQDGSWRIDGKSNIVKFF